MEGAGVQRVPTPLGEHGHSSSSDVCVPPGGAIWAPVSAWHTRDVPRFFFHSPTLRDCAPSQSAQQGEKKNIRSPCKPLLLVCGVHAVLPVAGHDGRVTERRASRRRGEGEGAGGYLSGGRGSAAPSK